MRPTTVTTVDSHGSTNAHVPFLVCAKENVGLVKPTFAARDLDAKLEVAPLGKPHKRLYVEKR